MQWLVIALAAITAIIVNVSKSGCENLAIAIIVMVLLAIGAAVMELQR
jgi:hypothetical protein